MAIQWLRCGHHVYVVSTCIQSCAACSMLYHLLLQTVNTQQSAGVSPGQPHLLDYDFSDKKEVEKAVNDLSSVTRRGSTYVIADEAGPIHKKRFGTFCEKLLTRVPRLHLWAANCFHGHAPAGWQVEYLTRPLRSPPTVVREVDKDNIIRKGKSVRKYSKRGVPDHTDGPPVRQTCHEWSHSGDWPFNRPYDCVTCCREVASFLHSLRVGVTENVHTIPTTIASTSNRTTPPCLQWRDVLMLIETSFSTINDDIAIVKELREAGIPVRVMKDDDIEDVATAHSDVVWVTEDKRVRGLERKVVVCVRSSGNYTTNCLYSVSRCTSQLVIVSQF
ncbi:uncharacterized protein LOC112574817 [Pomacea canaliculata]|uniref:uncharacterized protein LOC112574817 n=1 Tax=Pomacea canaliculata TaxID=400727 RepID=UPI000D725EE6|nr:uncharacterized protein LOC112574817 [Pomacea canaliculata]